MLKEVKGDITKIEADVIINAANTELIHGGGVALAIAKAAGEDLVRESKEIGFVPIRDFAVTTAGKLKAKKIIHIPTIDYVNNKKITYKELEEVLEKVFKYSQGNYLGEEDFITGWLQGNEAIGRPVDILIKSGGIIYISDDKAGVIYRVIYKSYENDVDIRR